MALAAGLAKSCGALNGGIKRVGIANLDDLTLSNWTFDASTNLVTTVEAEFWEFEFEQDTAEIRESAEMTNGVTIYTQEIEIYLRGHNNTIRTALNEFQNNCGFAVVAEDMNGVLYLMGASDALGFERPVKLASEAFTSGKELADLSGSTVTLSCISTDKMHLIDTTSITFDADLKHA
tara:strand:+ start:64 stop:597 length:534 start_codon:yes stop_codon:yes gene_type:complete